MISKKLQNKLYVFAFSILYILLITGCTLLPSSNNQNGADTTSTDTSQSINETGDSTMPLDTGNQPIEHPGDSTTVDLPKFIHPLTGLASERDLKGIRPVVISVNNTTKALPASGVSDADVLIELSAEGGETRLLMVALDYPNIGVIGSVRSARHNMIDFVEDFGAIFIHAGGSNPAYLALPERKTDNIDGVKGYASTSYFFRDSARLSGMGYEHSLMITGENIAAAIEKRNFNTELSEGFEFPLRFVDYGTEFLPTGNDAANVTIPYALNYRVQRLAYNSETKTYFRYHNVTAPFIDAANDEHLQFTNVIILYYKTWIIEGTGVLLDMELTGTGDGYYIYGGKSMPIKWTKEATGEQTKLTDQNGNPLLINRGKTYIAVARNEMHKNTELNSSKGLS